MVYISFKNLIAKPLLVRFDKINGFIRAYNGIRYLVLFGSEKYGSICNKIRYLVSIKSGIKYVIFYNYAKNKVDSYNSLPLEKTMTFHSVIILIKSFFNKDKNDDHYNLFLEKASHKSPKNKFLHELYMIYYDGTDVSERTNVNKTSESKDCDICHYWYLLTKAFNFQSFVCNRLHGLVIMSMNLGNIANLNIKSAVIARLLAGLTKVRP